MNTAYARSERMDHVDRNPASIGAILAGTAQFSGINKSRRKYITKPHTRCKSAWTFRHTANGKEEPEGPRVTRHIRNVEALDRGDWSALRIERTVHIGLAAGWTADGSQLESR